MHIWPLRDVSVDTPTVKSVPVVREFADIFPADLPGMPPDRDIDFGIDLLPGTQPISIPPYLSNERSKVDAEKIEAVQSWSRPSSATEIQSFLGLAGYCRRFLEGFSSIATPMTRLSLKGAPFRWTKDCEESFQKLKTTLTTTPVLVLPTGSGFYMVYYDALHIGLSVVLMQDGRVIAYASRQLKIFEDRLRACVIDFGGAWDQFLPLAEFADNNSYQSSIQIALYEDRLRTAQSRKKSYANWKVHDIAFMVGERVLLRISPTEGVMRFGKKGKLSPRYIEPFEILESVGEVAYRLALQPILSAVHPVFHVSMLRKYHDYPSHVLNFSSVQLGKDLSYVEEPVAFWGMQDRKLRLKNIASVKRKIADCRNPLEAAEILLRLQKGESIGSMV
ncbi:uncharacterized protein [Nicotiana tomentosiformis]|uniref:uncharacterized protein n=1 Tax=Nicotiana tomentosiformis TaxID=4098 RepID=UPI00388C898C